MSLKSDIDLLSRVPLFRGMNDEQLRLLAFGADKRQLARGHTLFTPGTRVSTAFVVSSGTIGLASPRARETGALRMPVPARFCANWR